VTETYKKKKKTASRNLPFLSHLTGEFLPKIQKGPREGRGGWTGGGRGLSGSGRFAEQTRKKNRVRTLLKTGNWPTPLSFEERIKIGAEKGEKEERKSDLPTLTLTAFRPNPFMGASLWGAPVPPRPRKEKGKLQKRGKSKKRGEGSRGQGGRTGWVTSERGKSLSESKRDSYQKRGKKMGKGQDLQ